MLSSSTSESNESVERMVPLLGDLVDDTFVFVVKDPVEIAIHFNVRECYDEGGECGTLIGAGIAFLNTHTTNLGPRHENLLREQAVPVFCKMTMRLIGTINFSYLIVGPYHQLRSPSSGVMCLGGTSSAQLVGHRGTICHSTLLTPLLIE